MYKDLNKDQLLQRFLGNLGKFGSVVILTKLLQLLIIPIYWKALSPADFGVIGVTQMLATLVGALLEFGLFGAVHRLYFEWPEKERGKFVGAIWVAAVLFSVILCGVVDLLGVFYASFIFVSTPFDPYLRLGIWTAFFANFSMFPISIMRIKENVREYGLVQGVQFIFQTSFAFLFVLGFNWGARGFLLAALLAAVVLTTYYVRYMLREIDWGFSWRHLSEPMKFILPAGPASFVEGLNGTLDRFVLEKYAPLDVLGIYTLGRQFGAAFNFVNTILKTAWHPFVINVALQRSDAPAVIGRFSLLYLSILLLPALLISTLAQDFIRLTGQSEYFAVANFVPWFVLGYMFLGIGVIYGRGIEIAKKAHLFWLMPMSTLITNVVCVIVLIPKFGVWGAVAGFLLTFLIREVVQISLAFYSYPRPLFVRRIFGIFGLVSFAFVSTYWLKTPSEITNILVKGSICILVWLATLPLAIEREQLAKIWTKIKK